MTATLSPLLLAHAADPPLLLGYADGVPIVLAPPQGRRAPTKRMLPLDSLPFLEDVRRRQATNRAMRDYDDAERRRTEAAGQPWAIKPPRKSPGIGIYVPQGFPRQLPGRGHWPADPPEPIPGEKLAPDSNHRQEASVHKIEYPNVPAVFVSLDMLQGLAEFGDRVVGVHHAIELVIDQSGRVSEEVSDSDPIPAEPHHVVHVIEPTGDPHLERRATRILHRARFDITGVEISDGQRGPGVGDLVECERRASVHAAAVTEILGGGGLPEMRKRTPRGTSEDADLRHRRCAVAILLRLDGFSLAEIGGALDRDKANINRLIDGPSPPGPVRPFLKVPKIEDEWWRGYEDSSGKWRKRPNPARDWRKMRGEISKAIEKRSHARWSSSKLPANYQSRLRAERRPETGRVGKAVGTGDAHRYQRRSPTFDDPGAGIEFVRKTLMAASFGSVSPPRPLCHPTSGIECRNRWTSASAASAVNRSTAYSARRWMRSPAVLALTSCAASSAWASIPWRTRSSGSAGRAR